MFVFISIIILVVVLFKLSSVNMQLDNLEKRFAKIEKNNLSQSKNPIVTGLQSADQKQNTYQENSYSKNVDMPIKSHAYEDYEMGASQEALSNFFDWFKENWILKIGILLILTGFGWFISYAFIYNWIGPVERIVLGLIVGVVIIAFGDFKMNKSLTQGSTFIILGTSIVLITIYAARFIYEFLSPVTALSLVFAFSGYLIIVSLRYDLKYLAITGIIMATLAPSFTNTVSVDILGRFLYLAVVIVSSIWVMFQKNWREIFPIAVLSVLGYSLYYGMFGELGLQENVILIIAYSISGILFITNIFSILKFKDKVNENDILAGIINGFLVMIWTLSHVPEIYQSLVLTLVAIFFVIGSYIIFRINQDNKFLYLYLLISIVYIGTATAIELSGNALIFAYIFESAIISIAGYLITNKSQVGQNLSMLMIGPMLMSLGSFSSRNWTEVFHQDFAIILLIGIILIGLGYFYYVNNKMEDPQSDSDANLKLYSVMMVIGSFYIYALIWLSLGATYKESIAVMISLAIYTLIGISSYFYGINNLKKAYTYYGGFLLLLVVGRLVLIDVWDMELALRVATFVLIGILFVSTSFLVKKNKENSIN